MPPQPSLPNKDAVKYAKSSWSFVAGLLGPIVTIVNFIKLWQGDQSTINYVIISLGVVAILFFLAWIGFKKHDSPGTVKPAAIIPPENLTLTETPSPVFTQTGILPPPVPESAKSSAHSQLLYPRFYRWARLGLALFVAAGIVAGISLIHQQKVLDSKVIILVTAIDGPDAENYRITEELITGMKTALKGNANTLVVSVPTTVTVQQGSEYAEKLGRDHTADIVLWGWYGVTNSDVRLTLNIENLNLSQLTEMEPSRTVEIQTDVSQLESFTLQQDLSHELSALTFFLQGVVLRESGQNEKALSSFNQAMSIPNWNDNIVNKNTLLFYRGNTYLDLQEFEKALADYQEIVQLEPDNYRAAHNLGSVYMALGNIADSIPYFSKEIQLQPDLAPGYSNRGLAYYYTGDFESALADYNRALTIAPKFAEAYYNRGLTYCVLGEIDKAIADEKKAIFYQPTYANAYYTLGLIYSAKGSHIKSVIEFTLAIWTKYDNLPFAYANRGNEFLSLKNFAAAKKDLTTAIRLDPKYPTYYSLRSLVDLNQHNNSLAIDDASTAIDLGSKNALAYFVRGYSYAASGNLSGALSDLTFAKEYCQDPDLLEKINLALAQLQNKSNP